MGGGDTEIQEGTEQVGGGARWGEKMVKLVILSMLARRE